MASIWKQALEALEERLDEDLLPVLYAAISVPTKEIREELTAAEMTWDDLLAEPRPALEDLDLSAAALIENSKRRAGAIGAVGALAGAIAVPPEVMASLVHSLRLAQRLAVVYGFDPETDKGRLMMWRALAAAHEIDLPEKGSLDLKVRDLPGAIARQVPRGASAAAWVTRKMVRRTTRQITKQFTRLIPGLGTGLAVWSSTRSQENQGKVMQEVFRRAWSGGGEDLLLAIEAEIVPEGE